MDAKAMRLEQIQQRLDPLTSIWKMFDADMETADNSETSKITELSDNTEKSESLRLSIVEKKSLIKQLAIKEALKCVHMLSIESRCLLESQKAKMPKLREEAENDDFIKEVHLNQLINNFKNMGLYAYNVDVKMKEMIKTSNKINSKIEEIQQLTLETINCLNNQIKQTDKQITELGINISKIIENKLEEKCLKDQADSDVNILMKKSRQVKLSKMTPEQIEARNAKRAQKKEKKKKEEKLPYTEFKIIDGKVLTTSQVPILPISTFYNKEHDKEYKQLVALAKKNPKTGLKPKKMKKCVEDDRLFQAKCHTATKDFDRITRKKSSYHLDSDVEEYFLNGKRASGYQERVKMDFCHWRYWITYKIQIGYSSDSEDIDEQQRLEDEQTQQDFLRWQNIYYLHPCKKSAMTVYDEMMLEFEEQECEALPDGDTYYRGRIRKYSAEDDYSCGDEESEKEEDKLSVEKSDNLSDLDSDEEEESDNHRQKSFEQESDDHKSDEENEEDDEDNEQDLEADSYVDGHLQRGGWVKYFPFFSGQPKKYTTVIPQSEQAQIQDAYMQPQNCIMRETTELIEPKEAQSTEMIEQNPVKASECSITMEKPISIAQQTCDVQSKNAQEGSVEVFVELKEEEPVVTEVMEQKGPEVDLQKPAEECLVQVSSSGSSDENLQEPKSAGSEQQNEEEAL